jgi:hypothetical protein
VSQIWSNKKNEKSWSNCKTKSVLETTTSKESKDDPFEDFGPQQQMNICSACSTQVLQAGHYSNMVSPTVVISVVLVPLILGSSLAQAPSETGSIPTSLTNNSEDALLSNWWWLKYNVVAKKSNNMLMCGYIMVPQGKSIGMNTY